MTQFDNKQLDKFDISDAICFNSKKPQIKKSKLKLKFQVGEKKEGGVLESRLKLPASPSLKVRSLSDKKVGNLCVQTRLFCTFYESPAHIKKCFQFSSSPTSPGQIVSRKAKRDIEKRTRQLLRRNILLVLKFLGLITAHPGVLKLTLKSNINGVSGSKALAPPATKDVPHSTARLPRMGVPVN